MISEVADKGTTDGTCDGRDWVEIHNIGASAAYLCSDMANAVTGVTLYVDNGMHAMGMVQEVAVAQVAEN